MRLNSEDIYRQHDVETANIGTKKLTASVNNLLYKYMNAHLNSHDIHSPHFPYI